MDQVIEKEGTNWIDFPDHEANKMIPNVKVDIVESAF